MRSALALLVAVVVLSGAARAEPPCEEWDVVARGIPAGDSGIGGTGRGEDSGIGGTGIYGEITGFGSVCVNGLRVHTDSTTRVATNGRASSPAELALGQVVWIVARVVDGRLRAQSLDALSAVVGPLRALDVSASRIQVGRQVVRVPAGAILLDEHGAALSLERLRFGDVLDVHGLRAAAGEVVATRVARRPAATPGFAAPRLADLVRGVRSLSRLSLEGYVRDLGAERVAVEGVEVELGAPGVAPPAHDTRVWVLGGVAAEGAVRAQRVTPRPPRSSPDPSLVPRLDVPTPTVIPERPGDPPTAGDREPDARRRSPLEEVPIERLQDSLIVDPPRPPPGIEPLPGTGMRDPLPPRPDVPPPPPVDVTPQGVAPL